MFLTKDQRVLSTGNNMYGQLGHGDFVNRYYPKEIQLSNVIDVSLSFSYSVVLLSCPDGYSGPLCKDPVCYDVSSLSDEVCSSQGTCVAPNQCSCFQPSFGKNCEISEYHWKFPDQGIWNEPIYWLTRSNNIFNDALFYPGLKNEVVYFNTIGTYKVFINEKIKLSSIIIGSGVNIQFIGEKNLQVIDVNELQISQGSIVEFQWVNLIVKNLKNSGVLRISFSRSLIHTSIPYPSDLFLIRSSVLFNNTILSSNINIFDSLISGSLKTLTTVVLNLEKVRFQYCNFSIDGNVNLNELYVSNSNVNFLGTVKLQNSLSLRTSNISLLPNSIWHHNGTGITITSDSVSFFKNFGEMNLNSDLSDISYMVTIHNYKRLNLQGKGITSFHPSFAQFSDGELYLLNTKLNVNGDFYLNDGIFYASGSITCNTFYFQSVRFMKLLSPYTFQVNGNFTLSEESTLLLSIHGIKSNENHRLEVKGVFSTKAFIFIKIEGDNYQPQVGDQIQFISYNYFDSKSLENIYLLGAPFKNAKLNFQDKVGYFEIILSFGSVQNQGYRCHYLGNRRSLEINKYESQKKVMLSFTTPIIENLVGFGFDINGSISKSIFLYGKENNIQQYHHDPNITYPLVLNTQATRSQTIFLIGPLYFTLTTLIPMDYLENQKYIYFAEIYSQDNGTNINSTFHRIETYEFNILKEREKDCTNFLQPTRLEIYSLPGTIVMLVIYLIITILCVIFVFFRPLNTRGISPFFTMFFVSIQLFLEFRNFYEIPEYQGSLCLYVSYGIAPLQVICFIVNYFYFLKYFSIINLNENKNNIYKKLSQGKNIGKIFTIWKTFLKLLGSPFIIFTLLIFSYIFIIVLNTIVLGSYQFICRFTTLIILKTVLSIELITVYLFTILSFVFDIIPHFKLIKKSKFIKYIFSSDPYYFRAQILLYLPLMVYSLVVELYNVSTTNNFFQVVKNHRTFITLNTIQYILLVLIDVIFPLLMTMFELCKQYKYRKHKVEFVEEILHNEELKALFIEFCKLEYSIENISAYMEIIEFKKNPKQSTGIQIFEKYFNGNSSIMEVNISRSTLDLLFEKMNRNEYDTELYSEIELELIQNLSDTYYRFIFSLGYEKYTNNQQKELLLLEGVQKGSFFMINNK